MKSSTSLTFSRHLLWLLVDPFRMTGRLMGSTSRPSCLVRKKNAPAKASCSTSRAICAVKWRDWKLHFYWQPEVNEGKGKLESPYLFNITRDPKEETDVLVFNTWVMGPILRIVQAFNQSCVAHPNTPPCKSD